MAYKLLKEGRGTSHAAFAHHLIGINRPALTIPHIVRIVNDAVHAAEMAGEAQIELALEGFECANISAEEDRRLRDMQRQLKRERAQLRAYLIRTMHENARRLPKTLQPRPFKAVQDA